MSAALRFFTAGNEIVGGSGEGFYGDAGFGASVPVGSYQGRTFITSPDGTSLGPEGNNVKYLNAGSGILGQAGTGIGLKAIPNAQSSLEILFTYDTPVRTQNAKLYGYDRYSINNAPSGVVFKAAQLIHPDPVQSNNGSGDSQWTTLTGTGQALNLCASPGVSGLFAGNGNDGGWSDTNHMWAVALSASPNTIGSKTQFGLLFQVEYL
jgi:hypothetical protein